jgi:hypothetical protein
VCVGLQSNRVYTSGSMVYRRKRKSDSMSFIEGV